MDNFIFFLITPSPSSPSLFYIYKTLPFASFYYLLGLLSLHVCLIMSKDQLFLELWPSSVLNRGFFSSRSWSESLLFSSLVEPWLHPILPRHYFNMSLISVERERNVGDTVSRSRTCGESRFKRGSLGNILTVGSATLALVDEKIHSDSGLHA